MTDRSSKQVVQDAWRAFSSRDAASIAEVFTENAEWVAPEGNATALALNYTHHMVGRQEIVHFLTQEFAKLFVSDISVEFKGIHADGNTVVLEERMRAKLSNGNHYDNDYCFVFTISGGRISFVREYMDTQRGRAASLVDSKLDPSLMSNVRLQSMEYLRDELKRAALEAFRRSAERHASETFYCAALYTSGEYGYICDTVSTQEGLSRVADHYVEKGFYQDPEVARQKLKWMPCDSPYHLENEHLFEQSNELLAEIWRSVDDAPTTESDRVYREIHAIFADVLKAVRAEGIFHEDCLVTLLAGDQSDEVRLVNAQEINPADLCSKFESELCLDGSRLAALRAERWPPDGYYEP